MSFRLLTFIALGAAAIAIAAAPLPAQSTTTEIDAARHEVALVVGPFDVPAVSEHAMTHGGTNHSSMQMDHGDRVLTLYRFDWPVDGYAKGIRVEVRDSKGKLLPRSLLHHVIGVNLDRRQFIYPATERLFGIGKETESIALPGKLAVPLERGQRLGYYVAWHNDTGRDFSGVTVRVILNWAPGSVTRDLIAVLPLWLDVANEVGGSNTFDLVPGKSARPFEFVAPVGGRILGIGGHLHDYGVAMRLEDAESGATLVRLPARKDAEGHIQSMARKFYALNAIRLKAGHRYRVVAEYDSPLDRTLVKGAMGHISAVFAPDDLRRWPAIDPSDPDFRKDVASLGIGEWTPAPRGSASRNASNR
jgi:hypothetical protein